MTDEEQDDAIAQALLDIINLGGRTDDINEYLSQVDEALSCIDPASALSADIRVFKAGGGYLGYDSEEDTNDSRGARLVEVIAGLSAGDHAVLSAQTFTVAQAIVIPSGVSITGQGVDTLIVANHPSPATNNSCIMVSGFAGTGYTGTENINLRNFAVDIPTGYRNGIAIAHGNNITIDGLTISLGSSSLTYHALDIMGCKNVNINNVRATHGHDNAIIQIDQALSGAATYWNGVTEVGINADSTPCTLVNVTNSFLYSSGGSSKLIEIHRYLHTHITIENVQGEAGKNFVYMDPDSQCSGIIVSNCQWKSGANNGIGVFGRGGVTKNVTGLIISNCRFENPGNGIVLEDVEGAVITGFHHISSHATTVSILARAGAGGTGGDGGGKHVINGFFLKNSNAAATTLAIDVQTSVDEVAIVGGHITGYYTGIQAAASTNVRHASIAYTGVTTPTTGAGITTF